MLSMLLKRFFYERGIFSPPKIIYLVCQSLQMFFFLFKGRIFSYIVTFFVYVYFHLEYWVMLKSVVIMKMRLCYVVRFSKIRASSKRFHPEILMFHFKVLQDFPDACRNLKVEYLFDLFAPMQPRAFSIASSQKVCILYLGSRFLMMVGS